MEPTPPEPLSDSLPPDLDGRLARLGVLQEPVRRALYLYVIAQPGEVGRDQAAEAIGIRRTLAAFHLDKLAGAGLLDVSYRRLSGRSGPGAGRTAKLYRRSSIDHQVSVPPRDYELAAHLMATAVEEAGQGSVPDALQRVASRFGASVGEEARAGLGGRRGRSHQLVALEETLRRFGFEPYREGRELRLRNCPFHSLARAHVELACAMNLALVEGFVSGLRAAGIHARLDPRPDECCVVLGPNTRNG